MGAPQADRIMPVFVFARLRHIEIETGLILAGNLIVDIPEKTTLSDDDQQLVAKIIQALIAQARFGQMGDDALIYGWPDGRRPADADETVDNDELMASWAKTRIAIAVRVDPRNDGTVRIDSDLQSALRKMSDAQLQALTDDEFWDAIEPDGICPGCDPRLAAEARRRGGRSLSEQGEPTKQ